jgi:flavin-dependent dehydrogenase
VDTEVCVIGGGPAGSAFANRMAELGYRIVVVEREQFPRPHVGEALTPGVWPLLEMLNLRDLVEKAGFIRTTTSLVRWEDSETRMARTGAPEPGLNVDRGCFDQIALSAAAAAGASILQPAAAGRPWRTGDGWEVPVRAGGETLKIRARFLADASGRNCVLRGSRQRVSARTIALCGTWRSEAEDRSMTRIDSAPEAWFWGADMPGGVFKTMAFVDRHYLREHNITRPGLKAAYRELVGSTHLLNGLESPRLLGGVTVCDATCYSDSDPVGSTFIKLGEAAFSIDPLSSTGVQEALQSALAGSVVAHTLISGRGDPAAAVEFYRERQRYSVEQHTKWAGGYYHDNRLHRGRVFWSKRAKPLPTNQPTQSNNLLRELLPFRVALTAEASITACPCIVGNFVERRLALNHPSLGRPVAYLDGVDLVRLLETMESGGTLSEILAAWSRDMPANRAREVASWLCRKGILVRSESTTASQHRR